MPEGCQTPYREVNKSSQRVSKVVYSCVVGQPIIREGIMKNRYLLNSITTVCAFLVAGVATGCTELNGPGGYGYNQPSPGYGAQPGYYGGNPYYGGSPYYGGGSGYAYPPSAPYDRRERERLERERERLEDERRRLEEERRRQLQQPPPVYRPPREERCPAGFSPSEQKCSREERQRGCRDMRLPGGLGCVSR